MSALLEIKGIILRGLKNEDIRVKKAAIKVFEAIDADLDAVDYNPADSEEDSAKEVVNAILELNSALIELGEEVDSAEAPEGEDLPQNLLEDNDDS